MSYDPDLLELIKHHRALGHSPISIKNTEILIEYCDGNKDQLAAAVDYYTAELEDSKELMLIRLDNATTRLMQMLNSDKSSTRLSAARTLVNVIDRYAKLLGLDSPVKIDSTQRTITYQVDGVDVTRMFE